MEKIAAIILVFFALMPSSLNFHIPIEPSVSWTFLVLVAGFLGFFLLFRKINPFVKIIAVAGYVNCFFSLSLFISLTAYVSLVSCCYFYWLCTTIKKWDLIFQVVLTLVIFNCFFLAIQNLGRDGLLNWNMGNHLVCFGTTGGRMAMESLMIISAALILQSRYRYTVWILATVTILYLIAFKINAFSQDGFLHNPFNGRIPVWKETIGFANQYPWSGWGIGTFKILYHAMSKLGTRPWMEAHNDYLQVLYETGYPGLLLMLVCIGNLIWKLIKQTQWRLLIGLGIILADMGVHFPLREFQTFLIVIVFLAFCETRLVGSQVK